MFNCFKIEDRRVYQDIMQHEMIEVFSDLKNETVQYAGMNNTKVLLLLIRWIGFDTFIPYTQLQKEKKRPLVV